MYQLVVLCLAVSCVCSETVTVETSQGPITGQKNVGYNTFFGVPFAKVDEENPFGNSLPYPNFETPYNANDSSILCPQSIFQVSNELQCLRLNIYVPQTAKPNSKLPILVWFHGGGFAFGSAGEYGGQHLVNKDIIVVTANYRLGPYGFLCLNTPSVPGNQGMKDQIEALRWVNRNIAVFGGDPNKVTISGESYGGGAVDLHLYSEYETLFDKAIVQSGSIFDEGFYVRPDRQAAVKIAKSLGHNVTKTKDALKLIAKDEPRDVMAAALNLSMAVCKEKRFKGVKNFVTHDPFHLTSPDRVKNTKIMIGYTSMELLYVYGNQPKEFFDNLGDVFYKGLERNFALKKQELGTLSSILKKFYLGDKAIGPESVLELSKSSSDFVVNHSEERSIDKYIRAGADGIYKYLFSYIGGSPYKNISGSGASHTEELKYLFEWETPLVGDEQLMIRDRIITLWANFVKFGNPTPQKTELLPVIWTPVSGTARPYLNIDVEMNMGDHVYHERMAFWDLFWKNYMKNSIIYDP